MTKEKSICAYGEILLDDYGEYSTIGGAPFNFIYHINKLYCEGHLITRVGNDEEGKGILKLLKRRSIPVELVQIDNIKPTGIVKVNLNNEKVPGFEILRDRAYDYIEYRKDADDFIENSTALLYYGTLSQRSEVSRNTLNFLRSKNVKCFYDVNLRQNFYTKEIIENSLAGADVVKMNIDELKLLNALLYNSNSINLRETADRLISQYNFDILCITMGKDGSIIFFNGSEATYKLEIENVVNTVGAGDGYSAIVAIGYLNNWSTGNIIKVANDFAGDICTIDGAVPEDDNFYDKYTGIIQNEK
ncbi:MAG: hypothetical protein JW995_05925 [Melioribacteraceae bacterium]|nr:hypothetical protein [Melioribacteraceae bacterium]